MELAGNPAAFGHGCCQNSGIFQTYILNSNGDLVSEGHREFCIMR